jgi:hypothetical protein
MPKVWVSPLRTSNAISRLSGSAGRWAEPVWDVARLAMVLKTSNRPPGVMCFENVPDDRRGLHRHQQFGFPGALGCFKASREHRFDGGVK